MRSDAIQKEIIKPGLEIDQAFGYPQRLKMANVSKNSQSFNLFTHNNPIDDLHFSKK